MDILKDKEGRSNIRLIILVFVILSGIAAALLYFPPIPTETKPGVTSGDVTFTDSAGNPLNGAIELSGDGISSGLKPDVNYISWTNIPNARVYYNALDIKNVSVSFRIDKNSVKSKAIVENYGASKPASVNVSAPGIPVKYVEISALKVSFASADISIQYTDAELNGLDENNLTIYKYDSVTETWSEQPAIIYASNNLIGTTVDSLSVFAVSTRIPEKIEIHDTAKKPVVSEVRTYDETRKVKKADRTYVLSTLDVPDRGELEVDAIAAKNVAVRLKVNKANKGEIILDDFGKKNPVSVPLPGRVVKFVEIGASGISFSSANITIRYTDAELNGGSEDALTIYHWNGASWDAVPTIIDTVNKTLSASTTSLSFWGVATPYQKALRCDTGTSIGTSDTTDTDCATATYTVFSTGLLLDPAGTTGGYILFTAFSGRSLYGYFVDNTAYSTDVNITGVNGSMSMRLQATGITAYGMYQVGYYNPNGAADNFVGLFNSTETSGVTTTTITLYPVSFYAANQSAIIPANMKLAIRVWMRTSASGQPRFYLYRTTANYGSLFNYTIATPNASISGYVTNASSGLPLSGATVQTNTSLSKTTDINGYYNIAGLSNGTYVVNASFTNYATNSTNVTISGANVSNVNLSLTPLPTYRLSGYVTNATSGAVLSGATVTTTGQTTTTNATGYYNFTSSNGTYIITASMTDYNSNSATQTIDGADVSNVNISLSPLKGKILVATNRYVILEDPRKPAGAWADTASGFALPLQADYTTWNYWVGNQTRINATALYVDDNGRPLAGKTIRFTLYRADGTALTTANDTTNAFGLANFSYDLNGTYYYGNWRVNAANGSFNGNTSFIYNWWGCSYNAGQCNRNHNGNPPSTGGTINSPYSGRRDTTTSANAAHTAAGANCTFCHQSYDGKAGDTNPPAAGGADANHQNKAPDVHRNLTCNNVNCHGTFTTHNTNMVIGSCYNAGCHTPANRSDISNKSTLSGVVSIYSNNNASTFNATFHTPNSTVPCIICHGPMHNISKPDRTQNFTRNYDTESSQCTTCHSNYKKHNSSNTTSGGVNCTLCHSDDAHYIQVFSTQAKFVNVSNTSYRGNCTSCHQNASFLNALKWNQATQPKGGNYSGRAPPFIGTQLEHSDDHSSGNKYNSYWTPLDQISACYYCHGNTTHAASALGLPASFRGNNVVNSTIGSSTWCLMCHYPYSSNYSNMSSTFIDASLNVPPSIRKATEYYIRGRNHTENPQNDTTCYLCHNGSNTYTTITQFMHGVYVGGGGPDCLSCHNVESSGSVVHVNNSTMKISFHANLNNQSANSTNVSADNKKCWGCHQSDGKQPSGDSMGDKYTSPYTCDECHLIGNEPYANMSNAPKVTNHIWVDSPLTRIVTMNATCTTCHNNSVNLGIANINDSRNISNTESVSHYGSKTNLIDTIADVIPSQGCVYCHLSDYRYVWGNATNPKNSTARPHTETKNDQCYICHIETVELPYSFHNSSMYYAGAGKILVATNRYVVLDDPRKPAGAKADTGFALPIQADYATWNYWVGNQTRINATALYVDRYGAPVNNTTISFTLYWPNGTALTTVNGTTNVYGLANFSYDMNAKNYYGNWRIQAKNGSLGANASFIYNWWGCSYSTGQCNRGHSGDPPLTGGTINSPYQGGRDTTTSENGAHTAAGVNCTFCHQSFDGKAGDTNPPTAGGADANHTNRPSDVHRNVSCDNVNCHQSLSAHNTNAVIGSCYNSGCHTPANRSDLSNKSTLSGVVSRYSNNNASTFNATFHTPNSTVPCIICHGPMHAITKTDTTLRFIRNNQTEYGLCIACHQNYVRHNRTIGCPVCHSEDAHKIKVLAQNATYITLNKYNPNPARGNCTNCHQNSSFFSVLLSQSAAGNYTGQSPEIVASPLEHSNDPTAGQKWNQTPGYWTNSNQVSWCSYCHTSEVHSTNILGRVSFFKGNNTVNSTISAASSWCSSCHWQGYNNGSNVYTDMSSTFAAESMAVPPEITGNSSYGANQSIYEYTNHSQYPKDDATCNRCHGYKYGFTNITEFVHNQSRVGGPNCVDCHGTGGIALLAHVNVTATNNTDAIHKNLNSGASVSNATAYYSNNRRCWACHGNGTEPSTPNAHPSRYKTPYNCTDCHIQSATQNFNFTPNSTLLNVSEHYWNATDIRVPVSTCYACHNKSEMLISANDPDNGSGAVYGGANGGNGSTSHYGKKRADLRAGLNATCSYCHQNTSTAFSTAMLDPAYNRSISNHSMRYNSSNPACTSSQCHSTGWLHNSTLVKPNFTLPNSSFCLNCHGKNSTTGLVNFTGAVTSFKEKHNNTINCTECHLGSRRDIHPAKYLQPNASYNTSNSTAVDCTNCHQNLTVYPGLSRTPPKIPNPMHHSDNASNGTLWNATGYWTNDTVTSCTYCHNDTKHNATALGRPAYWKGDNTVNSSITSTSYWCAGCHYKGYSSGGKSYNDMTSAFTSANLAVPPEITNGTYAPYGFQRYYNHSLTNYTDAACKPCHGINLTSNNLITAFVHNITWGSCTDCHYSFAAINITTRPDRYVNSTMFIASPHGGVACSNCHTRGHKNIGARKACEDCHAYQQSPITDRDRHNITATPGTGVVTNVDCTSCHDSTLYNSAINNYGYNKTRDCDYCHTFPDKTYS